MKKLLTVSLVAMMAVSAAHADLASTAYVKGKTGDLQYSSGLQAGQELKYVENSDVLTTAVAKLDQAIKTVGGDLDDLVVTTDGIADNAITSAKIIDGEVKTDDIAEKNVTTEKIADEAVTTAKIANLNVTTEKIANDAVTTLKIADEAVTSGKIADGTIAIADLSSEVTGMMDGHQLKSNIVTDIDDGAKLQEAEKLEKYTSVSYVDTKVATATQNLPTLGQDVKDLKNEVVEMKKTDTALEAAIGVNATDIGLTKDDKGVVTSFDGTEYLTEETTLTGAALKLDATIKGLSGGKQAKLSDENVISTGDGVVKTVVGANGELTVTKAQVETADIADKNVTKAKLAEDVQTLIDGALPRSTLEGAAQLDADKGDGQYALTMKVENGVMTYQWDLISY